MADFCCQPEDDFRLSFPADPHSVHAALRTAEARFRRSIGETDAGTLAIVLAEVLNNVVEHAHCNGSTGTITVRIARAAAQLNVEVTDCGLPMPGGVLPAGIPPELAPAGDVDALPEGGFGWFLIRDLTQGLGYARVGAVNRLRFHLPIAAG